MADDEVIRRSMHVRPGDTLLVTLDLDVDPRAFDQAVSDLKRALPHVHLVVVTGAQQVVRVGGERPLATARRRRRELLRGR